MARTRLTITMLACCALAAPVRAATEYCIDGELDLAAIWQGHAFASEPVPTRWCVITEDDSNRVLFSGAGKSNSDMEGTWTVAYLPPDLVRIVNRESPPDVEFLGTDNLEEAQHVRMLDPERFQAEIESNSNWSVPSVDREKVSVRHRSGGPDIVVAFEGRKIADAWIQVDMAIIATTTLHWSWDWLPDGTVATSLSLPDGRAIIRGIGSWRDLADDEAESTWRATPGADPIQVAGENWPARVNMQLIDLADDVYLLRGVRTGFQHIVIDTDDGLVVGDAPAGWLEFHHVPPDDMVPGLGTDGLAERMIEFLQRALPGRPIHAVGITHFHNDHAGGARAFAMAGADVYAPPRSSEYLMAGFATGAASTDAAFTIWPVREAVTIGNGAVKLVPLGNNPHVFEMLGVWAVEQDYFFVSDIHVPNSDDPAPRAERAVTECWFAEWAVNNLPATVRVVNSHSTPATPVSTLAQYLQHDLCQAN